MMNQQLNMQTENKSEEMEERRIRPLAELNLADDFLFDVATVDLETCKDIIEISLNKKIKEICWKEGQKTVHNLPGKRGIRMDFYVEDIEGNIFNVEMQKRNEGNIPKRTRFYQALLDAPMLERGERSFDNMNATYIIVICCFDLFGKDAYCYTFENLCLEYREDVSLGDGTRKVILNTKGKNKDEVPKSLVDFLHYVECSQEKTLDEDTDERIIRLHQKICNIRNDRQMEVSYMKSEERDRIIREEAERRGELRGEKRGELKGEWNKLLQQISKKSAKGQTAEEISEALEEDVEVIRSIVEMMESGENITLEKLEMLKKQ